MSGNPQDAVTILIIFAIVGAIVFIADLVIFGRWIQYLYARYDADQNAAFSYSPASPAPGGESPVAPSGIAPVSLEPAGEGHFALESSVAPPESSPAPVADTPAGLEETPLDPPENMPPVQTQPVYAAPEQPGPFAVWPRPPFAPTWSLVDPFVGFQIVFILGQVIITLALLPVLLPHLDNPKAGLFSSTGILIQTIGLFFLNGMFVGVVAFYLNRYGLSLPEIGLKRPTAQQVCMGLGLGLLLFGIATGAEIGMGKLLPYVLPKSVWEGLQRLTEETTAGGMFEKISTLQLKVFFALAGVVAAPIGEEIFFRGFLYNALKRRLNIPAAIVISGLVFAIIHFGPLAVVIIFPMGMALAYVYERTGSLWVTITMHATNNGLTFLLAMVVPPGATKPPPQPRPAGKTAVQISVPMRATRPKAVPGTWQETASHGTPGGYRRPVRVGGPPMSVVRTLHPGFTPFTFVMSSRRV